MARTKKAAGTVAPNYDAQQRFNRRKSWFSMEWQRQEANRYQMALDEDYYDSLQWTEEEAAAVRARGQNPVVFNEVKPTIDWLIGTERRMRRDFKVLARNNAAKDAAQDAEVKTKLLKYLADVNRVPFERSRAFDDAVKAGLGWLEVGIEDDAEKEPIYVRAESWRNMLHDSLGERNDLSDSRYLFRFKEVDLDIAQAWFPDKAVELERASNAGLDGGSDEGWSGIFPSMGLIGRANMPAKYIHYDADAWINNPRKRVLLIECWNFEPVTVRDPNGRVRGKMVMHVSIMTKLETILEAETPYQHNRFPFVPVWCYRRKRDGQPYGVVRPIRGPQDDLNKRMSKSLFEASSRNIRLEKGAIDKKVMDVEQIRDEENSPDGVAIYADGAISGGKVQVGERKSDANFQLMLAQNDRESIRSASGVSMEQRGGQGNVIAAKGIIAKHEQGALLTAEPFDNLLLAHQMEGELSTSLIEQFYTEEKTFSITGDRFKLDYTTINQVDPVTGQKLNDVTRHKATFVTGDAPWRQTLAEAAFESAMQMLGQLAPVAPAVVASIIDLVFEWSDLPNKQLIVQRIRQATGAVDPDEGETPEQQALKKQKAELAQAQFQAELAMLRAQVKEAQAKGLKLDAEAMAKRLETVYMSAQAAQVAVQVPGAMTVADQLLESVGFEDMSGQGTGANVPAGAAPITPDPGMPPGAPATPGAELPPPQQADGAMAGIETPAPDGVIPQGA